jgi:hypothetical protein
MNFVFVCCFEEMNASGDDAIRYAGGKLRFWKNGYMNRAACAVGKGVDRNAVGSGLEIPSPASA